MFLSLWPDPVRPAAVPEPRKCQSQLPSAMRAITCVTDRFSTVLLLPPKMNGCVWNFMFKYLLFAPVKFDEKMIVNPSKTL